MELLEGRETKYTFKLWLNEIKIKEWFDNEILALLGCNAAYIGN
jgi:hypothetical protein